MKLSKIKQLALSFLFLFITSCGNNNTTVPDNQLNDLFEKSKKDEAALIKEQQSMGTGVFIYLDIYKALAKHGISNFTKVMCFDRFYVGCTEEFVFNKVATQSFDFFLKVPYKSGSFDCDNFALAQMVIAKNTFFNLTKDNRPVDLLFGEFSYKSAAGSHMINIFITPNGDVKFFEPQTSQIVHLTEAEIQSMMYCRF